MNKMYENDSYSKDDYKFNNTKQTTIHKFR